MGCNAIGIYAVIMVIWQQRGEIVRDRINLTMAGTTEDHLGVLHWARLLYTQLYPLATNPPLCTQQYACWMLYTATANVWFPSAKVLKSTAASTVQLLLVLFRGHDCSASARSAQLVV